MTLLNQMLYKTQNSDRHTQTSVNLTANHPTLLELFTNSNAFFCFTEVKFIHMYLFNELLTIVSPKAFVVYFSRYTLQQFIPLLLLKICRLFYQKTISPVEGSTLSTLFGIYIT
jgi:Bacterial Glycosyl hydrolase family 3 C-terminal domain